MLIDRRQKRWGIATAIAAAASLAVYIIYVLMSPNGARSGSLVGLLFASVGTGIIVFE